MAGAAVGASQDQAASPRRIGEREFLRDWSVTASYLWSRGLLIGGVRDLNIPAISSTSYTYTIADANGVPTGSYTTPIYLGSARPG